MVELNGGIERVQGYKKDGFLCSDEVEVVTHSDDAFAPVAYLNLWRMHLVNKNIGQVMFSCAFYSQSEEGPGNFIACTRHRRCTAPCRYNDMMHGAAQASAAQQYVFWTVMTLKQWIPT